MQQLSHSGHHGPNPFTEDEMFRGPLERRKWIERVMRLANSTGATFELAKRAVEEADRQAREREGMQ